MGGLGGGSHREVEMSQLDKLLECRVLSCVVARQPVARGEDSAGLKNTKYLRVQRFLVLDVDLENLC